MQVAETQKLQVFNSGIEHYGVNKRIFKKSLVLGYVLWFSKGNKSHLGKLIRKWFRMYKI
jgi:hypothetical protein